MSRRARIIGWMLLAVATLPTAAAATTRLAPGVDLLPGSFVPGVQPDGNTVFISAANGLIVFDTGRHPEHAQAIIDFARGQRRPVKVIVNSHWHLDHIGGNALLRSAYPGLHVYASGALEAARHGFLADYRKSLQQMIDAAPGDTEKQKPLRAELALIDTAGALAPDEVIDKGGARKLAGRKVIIGLEHHAATAGDVWLFDPSSRVLAAGDLVTLPVPLLDTACPTGWTQALDDLDRVDFALLVPGHGAPMQRAQFENYRAAYKNLLACAASSRSKTQCTDGWLHDVGDMVSASEQPFTRALLDYYLDNSLRADPAHAARLCAAS